MACLSTKVVQLDFERDWSEPYKICKYIRRRVRAFIKHKSPPFDICFLSKRLLKASEENCGLAALEAGENEKSEPAEHAQTIRLSDARARAATELYRSSLRKKFGDEKNVVGLMSSIEEWVQNG